MSQTGGQDRSLHGRVWGKVCLHLNGLGLASSVWALERSGAFDRLAASAAPLPLAGLAQGCGLRQGYLHLACKLLASQGLTRCPGGAGHPQAAAELTGLGRAWLAALPAYHGALAVLDLAQGLGAWLEGGPAPPGAAAGGQGQEPAAGPLATEARAHVRGGLVGAVMWHFSRLGLWEYLEGQGADLAGLPANAEALRLGLEALAAEGWAWLRDGRAGLTEEGRLARAYAPQYFAPVSYLPTFAAAPDLLAGKSPRFDLAPDGQGRERHLDRALDIAHSGQVFRATCRQPFLETVLPLFQEPGLAAQPTHVVDTGCGDGTLLLELYQAVRSQTPRGRHLERHPLVMVGAEFNPQAGQIAQERLSRAGVPHVMMFGDIADPDGLAAGLAQRGIDPQGVLHVSKSVLHNRAWRPATGPQPDLPEPPPPSAAVFLAPGGELIAPRDLARNLAATLRAWLPQAARHGLVVIEAHTVDPEAAAPLRARHIITSLDAYHGYSHQYLVEAEVQRWAARAAGFATASRRDLGQAMVGRPIMTVDHLRPA
ncbi:MAG: hypothetical protein HY910_09235 [Desulfarculus sp.]|nr:hypothetical protein [Desulfarculus sp.]